MKDSNMLRLIAAMVADIHAKVGAGEESGLDSKKVSTLLWNRQDWALHWEYGHLFEREEDNPDVTYVKEVLEMWRAIEYSYSQLDESGKADVHARTKYLPDDGPKFGGFDGNNEAQYWAIARTMIEDLARWKEFKGRDLNTHSPTDRRYAAMLEAMKPYWDAIRAGRRRPMTADELVAVLNAPY